jgi:hypothetical protein
VSLYLFDKGAMKDSTVRIDFCPTDTSCYDESLTDPSLPTRKDLEHNYVYRRIKHFSGYNVAAWY